MLDKIYILKVVSINAFQSNKFCVKSAWKKFSGNRLFPFSRYQIPMVMLLRLLTVVACLRITSPYTKFHDEFLNMKSPFEFGEVGEADHNKEIERTISNLSGEEERGQRARLNLRPRVPPEVRPSGQDHHRLYGWVQFSIN